VSWQHEKEVPLVLGTSALNSFFPSLSAIAFSSSPLPPVSASPECLLQELQGVIDLFIKNMKLQKYSIFWNLADEG
jgi:hypothetical protein